MGVLARVDHRGGQGDAMPRQRPRRTRSDARSRKRSGALRSDALDAAPRAAPADAESRAKLALRRASFQCAWLRLVRGWRPISMRRSRVRAPRNRPTSRGRAAARCGHHEHPRPIRRSDAQPTLRTATAVMRKSSVYHQRPKAFPDGLRGNGQAGHPSTGLALQLDPAASQSCAKAMARNSASG